MKKTITELTWKLYTHDEKNRYNEHLKIQERLEMKDRSSIKIKERISKHKRKNNYNNGFFFTIHIILKMEKKSKD